MKKKIIIVVTILIIVVCIIIGIIFFLKPNYKEIPTLKLNYVDLANQQNESDKIELIKKNVVRVINKINDDISIIGTGFFDSDGYLITNSHVVDIKGSISVMYADGNISKAKIVSNDISSDIAILVVDDVKALALKLDETLNLKTADTLYAIGYPLNLAGEATVTKGILSARRSIAGIEYLQTDTSIDNGSSGGPLINDNGGIVGMNSLASNTSNINLALSSETIQNVLNKLKSNKKVTYITGERPENALSNILHEVGYTEIDIYGEWSTLNKLYNLHIGVDNNNDSKNNLPNDESQTSRVLDDDSLARNISISGYDIGFNSYEYAYKFHMLNAEDSLNISVTPNSSKATYKIVGNGNFKLGSNIISVIVTAENGSKTTYTIYAMKPVNEMDGVSGVSCSCQNYSSPSIINIVCSVVDSQGNNLYSSDYPTHIINTIYVEAYVKVLNDEIGEKTINGDNVRYLKAYNFKASSSINTSNVPASELKGLLTDDDYENDTAIIYFVVTANTFKNGSFTTTTSRYSLNK